MKIGAVIVAGGLSSRMKDFKPLLPIGDRAIIELCINNFLLVGVEKIVVVTGYRSDDIIKKLTSYNINFVNNINYSTTHMFDSVVLGLNEIKSKVDLVFISPSDSPFVQQFTLKAMIEEMNNKNICLLQPSFEGENGHPLLLNKSGIEKVLSHDGKLGLQGAIAKMKDNIFNKPFVDPGLILDADTLDDYEKLLKFNKNKSCPSQELCYKIQDYFNMTENLKAHSEKVFKTSLNINEILRKQGIELDINTIIAASLLHDIGKGYYNHAEIGAHWLKDMGYIQVSEIVKEHMSINTISEIPTEKEVVYLADKLVQDDYSITIEEKFNMRKGMFTEDKDAIFAVEQREKQAFEIYKMIFNNNYIGG